jgi:mRNA interferase HigB
MKNIIALGTLVKFWEQPGRHDAEQPLRVWYSDVKKANWLNPHDVKKQFGSASLITNNRVVFNIKGNKYRLVVQINYSSSWVFVRFIGTHDDYDEIDATTI